MFGKLLKRFRSDELPAHLYGQIVAQARQPRFYSECGVPDTPEGRFDMIVLHLVLVVRRLRREGERGNGLAQAVIEAFFADMDRSLREMGVGDLVVPKRVRGMAEAFYGRASAYERAFDSATGDTLEQTLARNIYGAGAAASPEAVHKLMRYVARTEERLAVQPGARALSGDLAWAPIDTAPVAGARDETDPESAEPHRPA